MVSREPIWCLPQPVFGQVRNTMRLSTPHHSLRNTTFRECLRQGHAIGTPAFSMFTADYVAHVTAKSTLEFRFEACKVHTPTHLSHFWFPDVSCFELCIISRANFCIPWMRLKLATRVVNYRTSRVNCSSVQCTTPPQTSIPRCTCRCPTCWPTPSRQAVG